jgi:acyl carrier protein phosphodiesterase
MGYDSRLLGDLQVDFKGDVETSYPQELLEVSKKV